MGRIEISAAIASVIRGAAPEARVREYLHYTARWDDFVKASRAGETIHTWCVTRTKLMTRRPETKEIEKGHVFRVAGRCSLSDKGASEAAFQGVVDAVADAFLQEAGAAEPLGGACDTIAPDWGPMKDCVGLQVEQVATYTMGGVLCYGAECVICAIEPA